MPKVAGYFFSDMAGNISVIEPEDNFQKVSKDIIFNKEISALALGVYVKVLALGKEWQLNVKGLSKILSISEAKVRNIFSELERAGYLRRIHVQDEKGKFTGFDYHVGAIPFPEEERTDTRALHSNLTKTQPWKNPTLEKSNLGETQRMDFREDIYRDIENIIETKKEDRDNKSRTQKFDFLAALTGIGVPLDIAADWMQVRKAAKAVNTKTAFDDIEREIRKSGHTAEECVRLAVVKNWRGFKASWMLNAESEEKKTLANARKARIITPDNIAEHYGTI